MREVTRSIYTALRNRRIYIYTVAAHFLRDIDVSNSNTLRLNAEKFGHIANQILNDSDFRKQLKDSKNRRTVEKLLAFSNHLQNSSDTPNLKELVTNKLRVAILIENQVKRMKKL